MQCTYCGFCTCQRCQMSGSGLWKCLKVCELVLLDGLGDGDMIELLFSHCTWTWFQVYSIYLPLIVRPAIFLSCLCFFFFFFWLLPMTEKLCLPLFSSFNICIATLFCTKVLSDESREFDLCLWEQFKVFFYYSSSF